MDLPFWNIYGILAKTNGRAIGPLMIDLEPVFPTLCRFPGNDCQIDTQFRLDYKGNVRGYGTTIAGGYKDFFGMIDYNRTTLTWISRSPMPRPRSSQAELAGMGKSANSPVCFGLVSCTRILPRPLTCRWILVITRCW